MFFTALLRDIPAPAWGLAGAIVGVLGTLGATLITNSSNTQRFKARLNFDEKEKAKDREVDLRRSVYMTAAESVVGMRALLGRLGSVDPRNQQELTNEVSEFQKAMAKVSLVASEETREKVAQLASAYGRVFVELMGSAGACHRLKIDMEINRKSYDDANAERLRITAAIRESNESAEAKYKVDALRDSFQIVQTQIEPLSSEFAELGKKYHRELARLGSLMYEKVTELSELHAEVSGLIRGELGLDVDLEKMKQEQKKQDEEARQAMQNLFERVEREYYDSDAT